MSTRASWLIALLPCACATVTPTAAEADLEACAAGNPQACDAVGMRYAEAGDLARARPVLVDACRRGVCWSFGLYFSEGQTPEAMAREVCGDDPTCLDERLALFTDWRARGEKEAAWEPFFAEAKPLCEQAFVAAAHAREPDCESNIYYADYDRYKRACERWDAQTAATYQAMFGEAEQLPHYRGELGADTGPNLHDVSFTVRLSNTHACKPPHSGLDLLREPPAQDTAAYVKQLRGICKTSADTHGRDCLRLELYDRTKLDPRAPMTPEQTAQIEAKYAELYGPREHVLSEAEITSAAMQAQRDAAYARALQECRARAKTKADAWQARIDKLGALGRRKLNGKRADPDDPESPIVKTETKLVFVEGSGDKLRVVDQSNQTVFTVDGSHFRRNVSFFPSGYELQKYYDARCERDVPR